MTWVHLFLCSQGCPWEREIILNQFPFCFIPLAKMMLYTFPISSTASCSTGVLAQLEHTGHWQVCIYRELSFPAHVQWTKSALTSYPIYLLNVLLWRKKIFSMNDTCKYMCLHIKPEKKKKKKKAWESMYSIWRIYTITNISFTLIYDLSK